MHTDGAEAVRERGERDGARPGELRNWLLAALPPEELALIAPQLERVMLDRRRLLYNPERRIEHVYFLEGGIASILSVMGDGSGIESSTIGVEGMVGLPVFHGMDTTAEQAMMQVPAQALRMSATAFGELLPSLPTLTALLHRFSVYMFTFAAQNAACNRRHSVDERCAKWLLTVQDRTGADQFELTHDFISQMLGVRRASVTVTLGAFERAALIRATRSRIGVTNRAGLEGVACECYGVIRASLERTLGLPATSVLAELPLAVDGHATTRDAGNE